MSKERYLTDKDESRHRPAALQIANGKLLRPRALKKEYSTGKFSPTWKAEWNLHHLIRWSV